MFIRFKPRSLLVRAIIIVVTPVVLLQLVAAWVFFERHLDSVAQRLAVSVANDVAYIKDQLAEPIDEKEIKRLLSHASHRMNLGFKWTRNKEKIIQTLPDSLTPVEVIFFRSLDEAFKAPFVVKDRSKVKAYLLRLNAGDGILEVVIPHYRVTSGSANIMLFWTVGSSLLLLSIAILFLRNQVRPIRELAEAAEKFGKGQQVDDFKSTGATEVRMAAAAFIEMKNRIEKQITQRTEMLAGVSHDLRTPLTRMKLALAMLKETEDVKDIRGDVAEMEVMIDGYLAFARGAEEEKFSTIDLKKMLGEIVSDAKRAGAKISVLVPTELNIKVRPLSLKRCINNLVNNTVAYATETIITVQYERNT